MTMTPPVGSWRPMLLARPVPNAAARSEPGRDGSLTLFVRTDREHLPDKVRRLSWITPIRRERRVVLDRLGRQIWDWCDGQCTVESVIDRFAEAHDLTFHESRVAVTSYLKQLIQRGALAVQVEDEA